MSFPYNNFEPPFSMVSQGLPPGLEDTVTAVLRSLNQARTPLVEAFFSVGNIDVIQNRLRATILKQAGYAIDRQSDEHLVVIMRKVYAEYATNTSENIGSEVRRLNDVVLSNIVPMVAAGVAARLAYLKDASRLPEPLPRGTQTSIKGTKTFELFRGL